MVDIEELRFGWDQMITEYKMLSYSETNKIYVVKCSFIDKGKELIKYIEIVK